MGQATLDRPVGPQRSHHRRRCPQCGGCRGRRSRGLELRWPAARPSPASKETSRGGRCGREPDRRPARLRHPPGDRHSDSFGFGGAGSLDRARVPLQACELGDSAYARNRYPQRRTSPGGSSLWGNQSERTLARSCYSDNSRRLSSGKSSVRPTVSAVQQMGSQVFSPVVRFVDSKEIRWMFCWLRKSLRSSSRCQFRVACLTVRHSHPRYPRILNYFVAIYLIFVGLVALFNLNI